MQKIIIALLILPFFFIGCSLNNTGPGDDGQSPNWDSMGTKIQTRVKYVAAFAFSMDQVKPYKAQVCTTTDQIVDLLNNIDDQQASFDFVRSEVMKLVAQIENKSVRNAVLIFVDMVLTESFNYAWAHYKNVLESDEAKTVIIIAGAVGGGIKEACNLAMSLTIMSSPDEEYIYDAFTVSGSGARGG